MRDEIVLKVGGIQYSGWTNVLVTKSLRQMTGGFNLNTTDIYPGDVRKWNIAMGDECEIEINGQRIITGYMEDILIHYDSRDHDIQFGGRDKTGDLVDSSYDGTSNEWVGLTIAKIIEILCAPFGISVVVDSSVMTDASYVWTETFKANEGDTVFDLINKIAKIKAIIPVSYGDGKLTLTRAGIGYKARDILRSGVNILSGSFEQSNKDRFQTYIVKGQGVGDDDKAALPVFVQPSWRVTDSVIRRHRPLVTFIEEKADEIRCKKRAEWERNNRAGNSRSVTYFVQGWTQSNGNVWPLNAMVQVNDTKLAINETLLISELTFTVNEQGTITQMRLFHPDAFIPDQDASKIKSGWDWLPSDYR